MNDKLRTQKRALRELKSHVEELEETLEDVEHRPCNDCLEAKRMLDALAERVKSLAEENERLTKRRDELKALPPETHVIERVVVERVSHDDCRAQMEALEAQLIKERGAWEVEKVTYTQREHSWEAAVESVHERIQSHMAVCEGGRPRALCSRDDASSNTSLSAMLGGGRLGTSAIHPHTFKPGGSGGGPLGPQIASLGSLLTSLDTFDGAAGGRRRGDRGGDGGRRDRRSDRRRRRSSSSGSDRRRRRDRDRDHERSYRSSDRSLRPPRGTSPVASAGAGASSASGSAFIHAPPPSAPFGAIASPHLPPQHIATGGVGSGVGSWGVPSSGGGGDGTLGSALGGVPPMSLGGLGSVGSISGGPPGGGVRPQRFAAAGPPLPPSRGGGGSVGAPGGSSRSGDRGARGAGGSVGGGSSLASSSRPVPPTPPQRSRW